MIARRSGVDGRRRIAGAVRRLARVPLLLLAGLAAVPAAAQTPERAAELRALEAEFARIAAESGGTVGVSVLHLEAGERASLNGGARFPMLSSYKLPIAIALLRRVDAGEVSLDSMIDVGPEDLRPGFSTLAARHPPGGRFRLGDLLAWMAGASDNTASDAVLAAAGGPEAVTATLRRLGIRGVRVDRPEGRMIADQFGVAPDGRTMVRPGDVDRLRRGVPEARTVAAARRYAADPRDSATPDAMADLLAALARGRALGPASTAHLLRILTETETGPARLRGLLPPGTPVAHKTGTAATVGGYTIAVNDVGIVTLPDGRGHLAIAVLVRGTTRPVADAERAIARISRAAYDRWAR